MAQPSTAFAAGWPPTGPTRKISTRRAFLKATELCRKIDRYDNPKAFLLAIALRLWRDKRRKFARRRRIAPMESLPEDGPQGRFAGAEEDQPEEIAIAREQVEMVRRAVEALDDAHRVPLYLYYTAELPIEEIASLLKLPEGDGQKPVIPCTQSNPETFGGCRS